MLLGYAGTGQTEDVIAAFRLWSNHPPQKTTSDARIVVSVVLAIDHDVSYQHLSKDDCDICFVEESPLIATSQSWRLCETPQWSRALRALMRRKSYQFTRPHVVSAI